MNNLLCLNELSAKHMSFGMTEFAFARRIDKEYPFGSPDVCLQVLDDLIFNPKKLNIDNVHFPSYSEAPILTANIIDGAICYLIKEAFLLKEKSTIDSLGYYNNKLADLAIKIREKIEDYKEETNNEKRVLMALWTMLYNISIIINPTSTSEEVNYGVLSVLYYNLMYTVYAWLAQISVIEKEYLYKTRNVYIDYLNNSYSSQVWHKELNDYDFQQ